jgi:hypothetical protein
MSAFKARDFRDLRGGEEREDGGGTGSRLA